MSRTPRVEVSERLPVLMPAAYSEMSTLPEHAEDARRLVETGMEALRLNAQSGDDAAAAALAMMDNIDPTGLFVKLAEESSGSDLPVALYPLALHLDQVGRSDEALAALTGLGSQEAGLLAISVLAARNGRLDEARALVQPSLAMADRHARAYSIAAVCELEAGNGAEAQVYFAAAARIARRQPFFRSELQIAQRALLLMHLQHGNGWTTWADG